MIRPVRRTYVVFVRLTDELCAEQDFSVWLNRPDRFGLSRFGLAVSVWGHFGHDISVHTQLTAFVYLNDYTGRRNVTLVSVIPTPF